IVTGPASGNVYSRLLDDLLSTLPGISQAAAVGVPDPQWGEAVHVFLVPDGGTPPDLAEIRRLDDLFQGGLSTQVAKMR
ncbi:MAG TPA: hypothetical protein VHU92_23170, partial [Streptosporangiaceae bacterium]|nr:hypothetical protein [Streptosporangiaceae bacterium]